MKKCPYCAEEVQDEATVCRYCKRPIFNSNKKKNALIFIVVYILLFLFLYNLFMAFVHYQSKKEFNEIMDDVQQYKYRY